MCTDFSASLALIQIDTDMVIVWKPLLARGRAFLENIHEEKEADAEEISSPNWKAQTRLVRWW